MSIEKVIYTARAKAMDGRVSIRLHVRIGLFDKGQKSNLQTLGFAAKRKRKLL